MRITSTIISSGSVYQKKKNYGTIQGSIFVISILIECFEWFILFGFEKFDFWNIYISSYSSSRKQMGPKGYLKQVQFKKVYRMCIYGKIGFSCRKRRFLNEKFLVHSRFFSLRGNCEPNIMSHRKNKCLRFFSFFKLNHLLWSETSFS